MVRLRPQAGVHIDSEWGLERYLLRINFLLAQKMNKRLPLNFLFLLSSSYSQSFFLFLLGGASLFYLYVWVTCSLGGHRWLPSVAIVFVISE